MEKHFNTAGPNKPDKHYTIDPLHRWDLDAVLTLIQQEKYFVLHAPRQTGKTSCMLALVDYLNKRGEYQALYANIEPAQTARENVERGIASVLHSVASRFREQHKSLLLKELTKDILKNQGPENYLTELLSNWAEQSEKRIVLFLDEVDALVGDTLISLLRQIRSGYDKRPDFFPSSIVLCGVRDVRDYRIHSAATKEIITGGSAFNIKAESLRLGNFTQQDIRNLYQQHTDATGQVFEPEVLELAWHYTAGQPWLVNALAYQVTGKMVKDCTQPITAEIFRQAKEQLILRRDTHLDQLADKLKEDRVRRVIQPILSNAEESTQIKTDDVQYVRDLGLVNVAANGKVNIANEIYREIIPRELSWNIQTGMVVEPMWYLRPDGHLDMSKLLRAFQQFFREHSEHWIERFEYKEAGPQLLLQAFLQRIVNGGGTIVREYGLGRRRTDLFIEFGELPNRQKIVLELKLRYKTLESTLAEGLEQTADYMDKCGTAEGHLLIFDQTEGLTWDEKIYEKTAVFEGKQIRVWGC
jgi:hypothetical protein